MRKTVPCVQLPRSYRGGWSDTLFFQLLVDTGSEKLDLCQQEDSTFSPTSDSAFQLNKWEYGRLLKYALSSQLYRIQKLSRTQPDGKRERGRLPNPGLQVETVRNVEGWNHLESGCCTEPNLTVSKNVEGWNNPETGSCPKSNNWNQHVCVASKKKLYNSYGNQ